MLIKNTVGCLYMSSAFNKRPVKAFPPDETKVPPASWQPNWGNNALAVAARPPMRDKVMAPKPKFGKRKPSKGKKGRAGDFTINAYDIANKAWQASKYILSMINVEQKFFDVSNNINVGTGSNISNLSNVAEGSDYNNRDGNSILIQSIEFSGWISALNANLTGSTPCRIMLFVDRLQRGSDPVLSDILEVTTAGNAIVSPVLHYTADRFQVLYDKVITLSSGSGAGQYFSFEKKLHQHVMFQNTTGADASNWTGAFFLSVVSTDNTNPPVLYFYNRLVFTDN